MASKADIKEIMDAVESTRRQLKSLSKAQIGIRLSAILLMLGAAKDGRKEGDVCFLRRRKDDEKATSDDFAELSQQADAFCKMLECFRDRADKVLDDLSFRFDQARQEMEQAEEDYERDAPNG